MRPNNSVRNISNGLTELYESILACKRCYLAQIRLSNNLLPIKGIGYPNEPNIMFLAINPTPKNPTIRGDHPGEKKRFPFAGDKLFWKVLIEAGYLDKDLLADLKRAPPWDDRLLSLIETKLIERKYFLTEVVKCPTLHGELPSRDSIRKCLSYLRKEISLVRPRNIITFGTLVYRALTGKSIVLKNAIRNDCVIDRSTIVRVYGNSKVFPCYFPTGRGNSKKAIECLRCIRRCI